MPEKLQSKEPFIDWVVNTIRQKGTYGVYGTYEDDKMHEIAGVPVQATGYDEVDCIQLGTNIPFKPDVLHSIQAAVGKIIPPEFNHFTFGGTLLIFAHDLSEKEFGRGANKFMGIIFRFSHKEPEARIHGATDFIMAFPKENAVRLFAALQIRPETANDIVNRLVPDMDTLFPREQTFVQARMITDVSYGRFKRDKKDLTIPLE